MKLPQNPALTLFGVVCLAYLCGDLACALLERRFTHRPWLQQARAGPTASGATASARELEALLSWHSGADEPVVEPDREAPNVFPHLLGTLAGGGSAFAIVQMPASAQTAVVALGEEYNGLKLVYVGAREVRVRDGQGRERTLWMSMVDPEPTAPPLAQPGGSYKTCRQLRQDIDNKSHWIGHIVLRPVLRNGESIGVAINYGGGDNPFARLGILSGDVVLSLNNLPAKSVEDLPPILMELRNSETLDFQLERNGQLLSLRLILDP
jgi:type II secretion system protein C